MHDRHHIPLGAALALLTALVASTAAAGVKHLGQTLSPWLILWVQYGLCTLLALPWVLRRGFAALHTRRPTLMVVRSLSGWMGFACLYLALPLIPLVDASLLRSAAPLWVPLVVFLWIGEKVPPVRWLSLLGGFAGVTLILQPAGMQVSPGHLLGLMAGLGLAISMATTRTLSATEPAGRVLFYYFAISFAASTPMGIAALSPISPSEAPVLVYIGVSIFVTMVLYTRAYTHAPTSVIAPLGYVAVPLSGLLDWLLWGHLPGVAALAGALLVIASGIMAVTLGTDRSHEH